MLKDLNRKFLIIALSCCVCSTMVMAQQGLQFSQHMFNKYMLNHAYGGFDRSLSITGSSRSQWSTFEGAPNSINLNAHMPFYLWDGALGISLTNDQLGALSSSSASLSYNYVYESEIGLFSGGLRLGVLQQRYDGSQVRTPEGVYEGNTIQHNDPLLPIEASAGMSAIWSVAGYYINDFIEVGLSLSDFPKHTASAGALDIERYSVLNFFAEYNFPLTFDIDLLPSFFVKSDLIQTQAEIAAIANYRNQYVAGLGFRGYNANSIDAIVFYAGLRFSKKYMLTYSYDLGINGLRTFHEGTHEFVLNYNLQKLIGIGLPPEVIYNPRFL